MVELLNLDNRISKEEYERCFPPQELRLGELQRAIQAAGVPVVIVFEGWEAAGKGEAIGRLATALDPRGFKVYSTVPPTEIEQSYPWLWRFWNQLPAAGWFVLFDQSWYDHVIRERVEDKRCDDDSRIAYEEVGQFERQLVEDGAVIVKFWLQISKKEQKERFEKLDADPATAWRVGKFQRRQNQKYKKWLPRIEETLNATHSEQAPWTVIDASDLRYVRVRIFETLIAAIEGELQRREAAGPPQLRPMPEPTPKSPDEKTVLDRVDLSLSLSRQEYEKSLDELQARVFELHNRIYLARAPAVIVYEGWDAGGKGGNIRRLARGLDPRGYEVIPIGAPTAEEKAHQYLWRFWRRLPKAGHIAVFDRSWYGRVLVERVEGFCTDAEWQRAFAEINEFERQLAEFGTAIVKFWIQIDQEEQLRRFQQRQEISYKQWKITDEDWRNREKWRRYEVAVTDMLEKTSTPHAPWTILEGNSKLYARIKALRTVIEALEAAL